MLNHLKNELLHFFFFLFILAGFIALGYYSYSRETSYTPAEVQSLNDLIEREMATRPVSALDVKQGKAYAEIYGITQEEAARPVELFKGRE